MKHCVKRSVSDKHWFDNYTALAMREDRYLLTPNAQVDVNARVAAGD